MAPAPPWLGQLLVIFLLAFAGCSRTIEKPEASQFHIGATRVEILDSFCAPRQEQSFHKTGNAIWGPIEEFWPEVPLGSTVEVWSYSVQDGSIELYFIDGSSRAQGIGFEPEGAVFEGGT